VATFSTRLAASDRRKLTNHLDALRQLETALAPTAAASCGATAPLKTRADASPSATGLGGYAQSASRCCGGGCSDSKGSAPLLQSEIELRIDLITTAYACGVRRAGTLLCQPGTAGVNPVGGFGNHHDVSHAGVFNLGNNADAQKVWIQIDQWYAQRFAYLLKRLTDLQIIDTTVVAWITEIVETHDQRGYVTPVAGGGALGMQHGRLYSDGQTLSNLWVSVQKAMGIAKDTFGAGSSGGVPGLWKPV
jgi:hypothetical protein